MNVTLILTLLRNFLFAENELNTFGMEKPIQIVNAMYQYLLDQNDDTISSINDIRLNKLTEYLIRNRNLYGSEKRENQHFLHEESIIDPNFSQSLFKHIIDVVVFVEYEENFYGFIAEEVSSLSCTSDHVISRKLLMKLWGKTFKEWDGSISKLTKLSFLKIYQEYILPLFPNNAVNNNIFSIDNIVHPLGTYQFGSNFSYLTLLGDFLFKEKLLSNYSRDKPILIVNAMYYYLLDPNNVPATIHDTRKNKLIEYLIRNSDLYDSKEEVLDSYFIQSLFDHIISSSVFRDYGNVYGFIAEETRFSNCRTDDEIRNSLLAKLLGKRFQNWDGSISGLTKLSCLKIYEEYILPLFPKTENENSIFNVPLLEAVQVRSIDSYVTLLSDFFLNEGLLSVKNRNEPIILVNIMYKYLLDSSRDAYTPINETRLTKLSKYLIRNSDLYGSEEGEILDPHFIQSLFNHIINSFVFTEYGNVYGFIAEEVRSSNFITDNEIRNSLLAQLLRKRFLNWDGSVSRLTQLSSLKIYQEFILPLFPKTDNKTNIFSIDYIYAQAGSMSFRSVSNSTIEHMTSKEFINNKFYTKTQFDEYIRVAHIVEQLATSRKIDYSALRIFAVPALLHYVRERRDDLRSKTIVDIMNNQTEWQTAFSLLFSKLGTFFQTVDKVQLNSYRFKFLQAMKTYKNRSSLARSNLRSNCPTLGNDVLEEKVEEYLKCEKDCFCFNIGERITLTNVDELFMEQFNTTVEKYAAYERESLKDVFPDEIKKQMDNQEVKVSRGLFENRHVADTMSIFNAKPFQVVPKENDILQFYFPNKKKYVYYGLLRKKTFVNVSLINESNNEELKKKLGILERLDFADWRFSTQLKSVNESFDVFLNNLMKERLDIFTDFLGNYRFEKKWEPWWKEYLLPLVPFYSCSQAVKENNVDLIELTCSMDIFVLVSAAGEVSRAVGALSEGTSGALTRVSSMSLKAAASRLLFRTSISSGDQLLIEEGMKFIKLFTPQLFKIGATAVFRMIDPGFELIYSLGKGGLKSIGKLIDFIEKKYPGSFSQMQEALKKAVNGMTTATEMASEKLSFGVFKNQKVFYNSLKKGTGYGYKFIRFPDKRVFPIRTVKEFPNKVPVLSSGTDIYKEANTYIYKHETEEIDGINKIDKSRNYEVEPMSVQLLHRRKLELTEREFNVRFKDAPLACSGGRFKRSPDEICSRASLLKKRKARVKMAVEFATINPFKRAKIKNELRNYLFFEDSVKTELDFVKDWKKNDFDRVPEWSEEYKIPLLEVYNELRYNKVIKTKEVVDSIDYGMHQYYLSRGLDRYASFHDYSNIHSYISSHGYSGNPKTKATLYRLAIRQSDEIITEYSKRLYFVENRQTKTIDDLFRKGKDFEFEEFTSASTNDLYAPPFLNTGRYQTRVQYEMSFTDRYLRAKTEAFTGDINREETILLPGSTFEITDVIKETLRGGDKTATVKMAYKHKSKLEDIKSVMEQLMKLEGS